MADYINKNILSQAYIHVEPIELETEEQFIEFKNHIIEFARSRTNFYLHPDVSIEIEFEEGSLKARITIMGTIFLLMEGVANYPDFREGVSLIYNDSKRLAEYMVSEAQYFSGSKHQDVIRLEARTGVLGSLHKIILQLEQIKRGAGGSILAKDLVSKIDKAQGDIEDLINNLQGQKDIELVKNGLSSIVREIPENPKPPKDKTNTPAAILSYKSRRRKLRQYFNINS
ncbi:MAG: hypothetical protein KZQ96_23380 [Candidatus Thiodiazotropha sp. (ex Lucinoma borealis)]|nr:hypothetical protein [Candidatus Thiodiazotropha sp. (ex Lucinoma borealis)]